jgi:hypothetical protein
MTVVTQGVVRIQGFDDVNINDISPDAQVVFYYDDGTFAENINAVRARCPHAKLIPIAVNAGFSPSNVPRAMLDNEPGDATNDQLVGWYHLAKSHGVEVPLDYTSISNAETDCRIMEAAGLKYGIDFGIHTAHYTGVPHLCTPACGFGFTRTAHNTQYMGYATGGHADLDLCSAFGIGLVVPVPDPNHYDWYDDVKRDLFNGNTEKWLAMQYDEERAKIKFWELELGNDNIHTLRNMCGQGAARIEHEIEIDLIHGQRQPLLYHRLWRRNMLTRRADGHIVTVK